MIDQKTDKRQHLKHCMCAVTIEEELTSLKKTMVIFIVPLKIHEFLVIEYTFQTFLKANAHLHTHIVRTGALIYFIR